MNTVLLIMLLGQPTYFVNFADQARCEQRAVTYSTIRYKKDKTARCVAANSPEVLALLQGEEERK